MAAEIFDRVLAWMVPFVLGGVVGSLTLWLTVLRSVRDGVQCLLRAEIIRQNEKWTASGYCPIYAKQALARAYNVYHALKGNDVATQLYKETMDLPEIPAKERSDCHAET